MCCFHQSRNQNAKSVVHFLSVSYFLIHLALFSILVTCFVHTHICFLPPARPAWVKCQRVPAQVHLHTPLLSLLRLPRSVWGTTKPHQLQLQATPAALHCPLVTAPLNSSGSSKDELSIWLTNRTVTPPHSNAHRPLYWPAFIKLYCLPLIPVGAPPTSPPTSLN